MKSRCCVESLSTCPKSSSCSMVLRSDCSHGHSHKSLVISDNQVITQRKSKSIKSCGATSSESVTDSSLQIDSLLGSSLKNFAIKSSETFSFEKLAENISRKSLLCQQEFSESAISETIKKNGNGFNVLKELYTCKTSTPISSFHMKNHRNCAEEFKNEENVKGALSLDLHGKMSRTLRERLSTRTLSDSEAEDNVSSQQSKGRLKRMKVPNVISHLTSTTRRESSESNQSLYSSSNHHNVIRGSSATYENSKSTTTTNAYNSTPTGIPVLNRNFSPESPVLDISSVQSSMFDKFRWLLWRYIYLKVISINNFDVWLLLRLRQNRKALICFLLFPLVVCSLLPLYDSFSARSVSNEVGKHLDAINSSFSWITSSFSCIYSWITSLFSCIYSWITSSVLCIWDRFREEPSKLPDSSGSYSRIGAIVSSISSYFYLSKVHDSIEFNRNSHVPPSNPGSHRNMLSKEEYKSLAVEILEEKLNEMLQKLQLSHNQANQNVQNGIYDDLQGEISSLQFQFGSLSAKIKQLENDLHVMEKTTASKESDSEQHNLNFNSLNNQLKAFGEKLESLNTLKRCCDEKWTPSYFIAALEKHLITAFKNITTSNQNKDSAYHFFNEWLDSKFVNASKLSTDINEAYERFKKQQLSGTTLDQNSLKVFQDIVQQHIEALKRNITILSTSKFTGASFSLDDLQRVIKEAIMLYDADKTGLVDYALESGGGSVLGTRCSESYAEKNGKFSVFGLPLWSDQNSPRTAIQPDIQPGKCWAFKGSQGFLVIQLSYIIHPTGFTVEHIPVSLSPTGTIDSAPKEFSVWGLSSDTDNEGTLLGNYFYDEKGEPLQYFPLQNMTEESFAYVELKIHSNHGNLEYTCLYRFRVHGTRAE